MKSEQIDTDLALPCLVSDRSVERNTQKSVRLGRDLHGPNESASSSCLRPVSCRQPWESALGTRSEQVDLVSCLALHLRIAAHMATDKAKIRRRKSQEDLHETYGSRKGQYFVPVSGPWARQIYCLLAS